MSNLDLTVERGYDIFREFNTGEPVVCEFFYFGDEQDFPVAKQAAVDFAAQNKARVYLLFIDSDEEEAFLEAVDWNGAVMRPFIDECLGFVSTGFDVTQDTILLNFNSVVGDAGNEIEED